MINPILDDDIAAKILNIPKISQQEMGRLPMVLWQQRPLTHYATFFPIYTYKIIQRYSCKL